MDYYHYSVMRGYYANVWGLDSSGRPWTNNNTTWLMPTCKNGDDYFTFFGYSTSSPFSYANQGAYSCDAYKSTASSPKYITPVYTTYLDKLKTYYNIPLPEYSNVDGNGRVRPLFPLVQKSVSNGYIPNTYYEIDWENTTYLPSSTTTIPDSNVSGSWSVTDINIINTYNIPDSSGGDTPASDFSQISNAIYSLGAVIIVVCFFSMIYKIFHRLRG